MPVNWEQLHPVLNELRGQIAAQSAAVREARNVALRRLQEHAANSGLSERVAAAANSDPELRCALPTRERLDVSLPSNGAANHRMIIAADGSQVTPDRHDQLLFGVINIAVVVMGLDTQEVPPITTETQILVGESLYSQTGQRLSEGDLALMRDRAERATLLRHVRQLPLPAIALTDGPLEIWGGKDVTDQRAYEGALQGYLSDLEQMERHDCAVAGYIDKPAADLVIRLVEILEAGPDDLKRPRSFHPIRGVTDRWLFGQLLAAGHRSAIFGLQSSSRSRYTGNLALHFFYLNLGTTDHPAIARVEIPGWVSSNSSLLGALHAELVAQCSLLGRSPYPYILHRAHEAARISMDEKEEIRLKLLLELRESGIEPEARSGKSTAKLNSSRKGRY